MIQLIALWIQGLIIAGLLWANGMLLGELQAVKRDLNMTRADHAMHGRELDRCRIQRRDLREKRQDSKKLGGGPEGGSSPLRSTSRNTPTMEP